MPNTTMILIILFAKYLDLTSNLITFILHFKSVYSTINDLIQVQNEISKCDKSYKRIIDIIDKPTIIQGIFIPKHFTPSISFSNISFKYQKSPTPILNNFNFFINPYNKIAIIGSSGCGKSTLAKLLLGLLKIDEGSIYINGINIEHYDNRWLKNKIGYVAQDTILFSDTIANNISIGLENKSIKDIEEASKLANADEFISKLPNKYDTNLEGTELSSLSGGQKQRISIARALIRKPEIIIFDEATSALDPYCEEIVQKTIKDCFEKNNATMIVIAHRKSALEIVNTVYKLENSKLIPFNNF
jgi:subfamily B ATP-binding cassette protein MsbA